MYVIVNGKGDKVRETAQSCLSREPIYLVPREVLPPRYDTDGFIVDGDLSAFIDAHDPVGYALIEWDHEGNYDDKVFAYEFVDEHFPYEERSTFLMTYTENYGTVRAEGPVVEHLEEHEFDYYS